jgi:hypothetical protein
MLPTKIDPRVQTLKGPAPFSRAESTPAQHNEAIFDSRRPGRRIVHYDASFAYSGCGFPEKLRLAVITIEPLMKLVKGISGFVDMKIRDTVRSRPSPGYDGRPIGWSYGGKGNQALLRKDTSIDQLFEIRKDPLF